MDLRKLDDDSVVSEQMRQLMEKANEPVPVVPGDGARRLRGYLALAALKAKGVEVPE